MNTDQEFSIGNDVTMRGTGADGILGVIDQYEILRELGGGGFGTVYLARDTVAGIEVAVKGLPPVVKNNKEELANIRQNFALVSRLHHPNIAAALVLHPAQRVTYNDVRAHDNLRVEPGDTLMVMEYAPGVTLSSWRKQFPDKRVPFELAIKIVRQIASALDYAHREKILHRDIKPSNVMIESRAGGELIARVLDFGLAAELRSSMGRVSLEINDTSGTRPYMAPEQWAGRRQTTATDQYALAILFCELVSGDIPFASVFETGDRLLMMEVVEKKDPELPETFPAKLRATMLKALSKYSKERYASCGAFVDALESPRSRSKHAGLMIGIVAVAVSAMIFAGMGVYRKHADAKIAEAARQVEIARQAELARKAELDRQAEEKRQAEEMVRSEEKRKAEAAASAEAKRKKEAEAKAALVKVEVEKRLAEEKARAEAEERAKREAEARARAEAEECAKREAEAEARAKREAEAEARARREAEAKARARREAEAKARAEAEARAKREAEAEARAKCDGKLKNKVLAEKLLSGNKIGHALGDETRIWRTYGTPSCPGEDVLWHVDDNRQHVPCVRSGGGGAGRSESTLTTEVVGPCRIKFSYQISTYEGDAIVRCDKVELMHFKSVAKPSETWSEGECDISSGKHSISFTYVHPGRGWANQFNGFALASFSVSSGTPEQFGPISHKLEPPQSSTPKDGLIKTVVDLPFNIINSALKAL